MDELLACYSIELQNFTLVKNFRRLELNDKSPSARLQLFDCDSVIHGTGVG